MKRVFLDTSALYSILTHTGFVFTLDRELKELLGSSAG